jgi:Zn-finger nucleic acid-binding protein
LGSTVDGGNLEKVSASVEQVAEEYREDHRDDEHDEQAEAQREVLLYVWHESFHEFAGSLMS